MIYRMYCVFDMVAQQFARPFCAISDGAAARSFSDEVNEPSSSMLYKHPADFQLFYVSSFDDSSGVFEPVSSPVLVVQGSAVVRPPDVLSEAKRAGTSEGVH